MHPEPLPVRLRRLFLLKHLAKLLLKSRPLWHYRFQHSRLVNLLLIVQPLSLRQFLQMLLVRH